MTATRPTGRRSGILLGAAIIAACLGASLELGATQAGARSAPRCRLSVTPSSGAVAPGGRLLVIVSGCQGPSAAPSSSEPIRISLRRGHRWSKRGTAARYPDGRLAACVQVPRRGRVAKLRATGPGALSRIVKVRITRAGTSGCSVESGTGPSPSSTPTDPAPNPNCPLATAGSRIGMTLPAACTVVASDTASNPNPLPFWGSIDAQSPLRHQQIPTGGDDHPEALASPQPDDAFRRMTVYDGDDFYGERAELGLNDRDSPVAFYREGERRVTYASLRLPDTTAMGSSWRTVLQMKQAEPYNNPTPAPIIELNIRGGQWVLFNSWNPVWSAPAQQGVWTRFAFDVVYSADPTIGSITVYVDLNGDDDFADPGEQSAAIHTATLEAETVAGGYSPYSVGQPIPDHLRAGIYEDPSYSCPSGCSMDLDNVQVVRP